MPHRIEHAQCVKARDVRRMAAARIVASVQPCHIPGDIATADRHWPRARQNAYPFRRLLRAGVTLAAGSDIPVERIDPRLSFYGACVRADESGQPADGWFADERLTTREVLEAFTRGAAAATGQHEGGEIRPGAPADLTIWGADPLRVPAREFREIPILGCVIGGTPHIVGAG
jgi:predicted amidohydrolase YtcJ